MTVLLLMRKLVCVHLFRFILLPSQLSLQTATPLFVVSIKESHYPFEAENLGELWAFASCSAARIVLGLDAIIP